jgi:beta-lactam-binding protein with PASTA domain
VTVPGVVGLNCPDAKSTLLNAGLRVSQHLVADDDPGNHGVVLSQSPGGGARVTKGSTVVITLGSFEPDPPASC